MVSAAGVGPQHRHGVYTPHVPPQPVSVIQKITSIVLSILCFTSLPPGWNVVCGFSVLAFGLLYPLKDRAAHAPQANPWYNHLYGYVPSFVWCTPPTQVHQAGPRFVPGHGVRPQVPQYTPPPVPSTGHQAGPRFVPGQGAYPVFPPQASIPQYTPPPMSLVGHQQGRRRPPGQGSHSFSPPAYTAPPRVPITQQTAPPIPSGHQSGQRFAPGQGAFHPASHSTPHQIGQRRPPGTGSS